MPGLDGTGQLFPSFQQNFPHGIVLEVLSEIEGHTTGPELFREFMS